MSTLLNKSYLVKVSTKGEGGSKMPQILSTWFVHSPLSKQYFLYLSHQRAIIVQAIFKCQPHFPKKGLTYKYYSAVNTITKCNIFIFSRSIYCFFFLDLPQSQYNDSSRNKASLSIMPFTRRDMLFYLFYLHKYINVHRHWNNRFDSVEVVLTATITRYIHHKNTFLWSYFTI